MVAPGGTQEVDVPEALEGWRRGNREARERWDRGKRGMRSEREQRRDGREVKGKGPVVRASLQFEAWGEEKGRGWR